MGGDSHFYFVLPHASDKSPPRARTRIHIPPVLVATTNQGLPNMQRSPRQNMANWGIHFIHMQKGTTDQTQPLTLLAEMEEVSARSKFPNRCVGWTLPSQVGNVSRTRGKVNQCLTSTCWLRFTTGTSKPLLRCFGYNVTMVCLAPNNPARHAVNLH